MLTPIALVEKARREQAAMAFRALVLAGYELCRGDEERAKADALRARTIAALDWGEGPKSIDAIVQEFLRDSEQRTT